MLREICSDESYPNQMEQRPKMPPSAAESDPQLGMKAANPAPSRFCPALYGEVPLEACECCMKLYKPAPQKMPDCIHDLEDLAMRRYNRFLGGQQ